MRTTADPSPLDAYAYDLPGELIAKEPASPRDSSRLMVYETATDTLSLATFRDLPSFLPINTHLVFNDTKVVPARVHLRKETGGRIEVLLLVNEGMTEDGLVKGIVDRKITPGATLFFSSGASLRVIRQEEQYFFFRPRGVSTEGLFRLLAEEGETPIPPYIKDTPLGEMTLRERYQSVFATNPASVAAPTASLHFTDRVLTKIGERGITSSFVTLHVGMGTFAPVGPEHFASGRLFTERIRVTPDAAEEITAAKKAGRMIIPVGTTALRTIESAAHRSTGGAVVVEPCQKETDLFIRPPYTFMVADGILTNFHTPRSSLMLLVDAILGAKGSRRRILDLYAIAVAERFRFYSFGDAMLIR